MNLNKDKTFHKVNSEMVTNFAILEIKIRIYSLLDG